MKSYLVKNRINHDGKDFEVGSVIELDEKNAESLLTVGAIEDGDFAKSKEADTSDVEVETAEEVEAPKKSKK